MTRCSLCQESKESPLDQATCVSCKLTICKGCMPHKCTGSVPKTPPVVTDMQRAMHNAHITGLRRIMEWTE